MRQCACGPLVSRMLRHVELDGCAPVVPKNHKTEQGADGRRRHDEEVDGGNLSD